MKFLWNSLKQRLLERYFAWRGDPLYTLRLPLKTVRSTGWQVRDLCSLLARHRVDTYNVHTTSRHVVISVRRSQASRAALLLNAAVPKVYFDLSREVLLPKAPRGWAIRVLQREGLINDASFLDTLLRLYATPPRPHRRRRASGRSRARASGVRGWLEVTGFMR